MKQQSTPSEHATPLTHYSPKSLTVLYRTGIDTIYLDKRGCKAHKYIKGVHTPAGDFDLITWMDLVENMASRLNELAILDLLIQWSVRCPWLYSQFARKQYALELYACRCFEDPSWIGYSEFNTFI